MKGPLVIFTGLSMMTHEAERYAPPDADIRPPAQRGDIESAVQQYSNPGRIALFDGKFFQAEAISIIEIREAIERGWSVIGGASMGALRAIESAPLA
jgi:TfuA protein